MFVRSFVTLYEFLAHSANRISIDRRARVVPATSLVVFYDLLFGGAISSTCRAAKYSVTEKSTWHGDFPVHQSHARMKTTVHRKRRCDVFVQDLFQLAEDMGMTDRLRSIALGQGQGTIAAAMIEKVKTGSVVMIESKTRLVICFFRKGQR